MWGEKKARPVWLEQSKWTETVAVEIWEVMGKVKGVGLLGSWNIFDFYFELSRKPVEDLKPEVIGFDLHGWQ